MSQPSVWKKLFTALRGGVNDAAESVVDKNAMRILDQEIRDASTAQEEAKSALTGILAKKSLQEKSIVALDADIKSLTEKALKADAKGEQALAIEIAELIGQKQQLRDAEQKQLDQYSAFADKQNKIVVTTAARIKGARQQADLAKARESIQTAQQNVMQASGSTNGGLSNAMDSLNRIREKQDLKDAEFEARETLENDISGVSLEAKMQAAGLVDDKYSGSSILDNLKKQQA